MTFKSGDLVTIYDLAKGFPVCMGYVRNENRITRLLGQYRSWYVNPLDVEAFLELARRDFPQLSGAQHLQLAVDERAMALYEGPEIPESFLREKL